MFPALVNCCTIDWFREWPAEALASVATSFFQVHCFQPPISEHHLLLLRFSKQDVLALSVLHVLEGRCRHAR